jgi:hypothetical protein
VKSQAIELGKSDEGAGEDARVTNETEGCRPIYVFLSYVGHYAGRAVSNAESGTFGDVLVRVQVLRLSLKAVRSNLAWRVNHVLRSACGVTKRELSCNASPLLILNVMRRELLDQQIRIVNRKSIAPSSSIGTARLNAIHACDARLASEAVAKVTGLPKPHLHCLQESMIVSLGIERRVLSFTQVQVRLQPPSRSSFPQRQGGCSDDRPAVDFAGTHYPSVGSTTGTSTLSISFFGG